MKTTLNTVLFCLTLFASGPLGHAQGTAFTYQGQLKEYGIPAQGTYDLRFTLFGFASGGAQIGSDVTSAAVPITNGLFTVVLDFGADIFSGPNRWLEIGVRSNSTIAAFITLSPRSELTPSPYAIFAGGANAAGLRGIIDSNNIAPASITSAMLAAGSVTGVQLAPGSVGTDNLAAGAVTADKVATTSDWFALTIPNPTPNDFDRFGSSVAAFGNDRVIIGAPEDDTGATNSGAAYLFGADGRLLTIFSNPTPADSDNFGNSVAALGNGRVLVGAPGDSTGAPAAGAAYLFRTNGTLLITLTNPTPAVFDSFGYTVAALGSDRLLIGAFSDDTGAVNGGVVYQFSTNGTLLTTFTNPAPAPFDNFGAFFTAVGNDRVLISAPQDDTGAENTGAAYLFSTNGTLLTTFPNPTPAAEEAFGASVAAMGNDRVLIGASGARAAYLFATDGALLGTFQGGFGFGFSVAAVGIDRVLIGAYLDRGGPGAAYLFSTNGTLLTTFTNPAPVSLDLFGYAVASLNPARLLIGAVQHSVGARDTGAAYLFSIESFTDGLVADAVRARSVTTVAIEDSAVTVAKLANGAVTAAKLDPAIGVWTASGTNVYRPGGGVGIGTASPRHRLRISGGPLWTTEGWQGEIELDNAAAIGWNANPAGSRFGLGQSSGGLYFFRTASDPGTTTSAPSYIMALSDTGNVGIGTPSPAFQLQLSADSAGKPNGGSWANASDARVKKNIQPLSGALEKLTRLRGVSFEWINPEDHAHQIGRQAGFIAQELEQVFPNWVSEVPGAKHDAALTPDGRVKSLSLPFEFDALTVEALRELRAENAELKKRLARVEELLRTLSAEFHGRTPSIASEARGGSAE
jgi:hypothetical protein